MKNNKNDEEEKEKKSRWQKFREYLASLNEKFQNRSEVKTGLGLYNKITQSSPYKILTGKAVGRAITIGTIIAGAVGLLSVAPIALGVMAAGVALAVGVESYMSYKTKQIYKEAKMLRDNKIARNKQSEILKSNPKLAKALEKSLFTPKTKGLSKSQKSEKSQKSIFTYIGGAVVSGFEKLGGLITSFLSGNPVSMIVGLAGAVTGVSSEGSSQYSMSQTRANLINFINQEKGREYSPAYDDKKSLKDQVNKQRIQTLALEELSKINEIRNWSNEKIHAEFNSISEKLAKRANKLGNRNILVKYSRKLFKNVVRAHDPFSKYNDPKKLQESIIPNEKDSAAKSIEKQNLKKISAPLKKRLNNNVKFDKSELKSSHAMPYSRKKNSVNTKVR